MGVVSNVFKSENFSQKPSQHEVSSFDGFKFQAYGDAK
jgi:hypothetical protein